MRTQDDKFPKRIQYCSIYFQQAVKFLVLKDSYSCEITHQYKPEWKPQGVPIRRVYLIYKLFSYDYIFFLFCIACLVVVEKRGIKNPQLLCISWNNFRNICIAKWQGYFFEVSCLTSTLKTNCVKLYLRKSD